MSEDREQVDESGVASETEDRTPVAQNQEGDSSQEIMEEELLEEVAEWADEEDLQALAEEQAERDRRYLSLIKLFHAKKSEIGGSP